MSWRRLLLAVAATVALTGCDLAPSYHVPLVSVPVAYKEAALWQPAHPVTTLLPDSWWTIFDDPELDRLEGRVAGGNQRLAEQQAAYDEARALAGEAEAGLFPQLTLGGDITTNRQSNRRPLRGLGQPNQYMDNEIDVQADYEIDVWKRIANEVKAGTAAAQASAADLATVALSLHAELAGDYLTLRGLDAQAALLRETVAEYAKAAAVTQNRFAGRIASEIDVTRAQTQLRNAEADVADITARRAVMEHAIAVLIGVPPAQLSLAIDPAPVAIPAVDGGLPSELLERRPDIAASERQAAAANAMIGVARAAFYPRLSLQLLFGVASTGLDVFNAPDSMWTLGPGLAMPLFEGGLRHAEERAQVAKFNQAQAQYRQTVLSAFREVEDNLALLHWLGQEQADADQAVAASKRTLDLSMPLYVDGAVSYLDVVTAQTAATDASLRALKLRTRRLEATVGLIRALGGGWQATDLPLQAGLSTGTAG